MRARVRDKAGTGAGRRGGMAMVYSLCAMVAFCAFASLAVDWGRVQLVRTELMGAADAAARAGAAKVGQSADAADQAAVAVGAWNSADGQPVKLDPSADVEIGLWDDASGTFTPGLGPANAVRTTARRTAARGNPVRLTFAGLIGRGTCDVTASATAVYYTTPAPTTVTNKSNPWLAGMPDGTTANGFDAAPTASPTLLAKAGLVSGAVLTFDASGATSNQTGVEKAYPPDGNNAWVIHNYAGSEHGVADLYAPISALIGVFLDDTQPDSTPAHSSLDFSTSASRDFSTLAPQLKQPFFIGDGRRLDGTTIQQFVVPAGATRLFVGSMDGQQWSDNDGGFSVTIKSGVASTRVVMVK